MVVVVMMIEKFKKEKLNSSKLKYWGIFLFLIAALSVRGQSPHGSEFELNCATCHEAKSWDIPPGAIDTTRFNHDKETHFVLEGQHRSTACRNCHPSLVFAKAKKTQNCIDCHDDIHQQTVGSNCNRCHTPSTWLLDKIPEIHEHNGFPLIGAHDNADCKQCHLSENDLRFDRIGNDCINCHRNDYAMTESPNHTLSGFSKDCLECHNPLQKGWTTEIVNHDFFPLTEGHDIQNCSVCHTTGKFSDASPECVSCHQGDFSTATAPDHEASGFSTDCTNCHNRSAWTPATFDHDQYYVLKERHAEIANNCNACHTEGFANTPTTCAGCHQEAYDNTTNPNHAAVGFSTDCAVCHSETSWTPSNFNHNDIYPLNGAHAAIANNCDACHHGNYNNTPSACVDCHQQDYDNTNNPNHNAAQFPTDCSQCHSESSWAGATFDHDGQYFPIYSGKHQGEWSQCIECHTVANDYSKFSCIDCHEHNNASHLANEHDEVSGFVYQSSACYSCHPDGSE